MPGGGRGLSVVGMAACYEEMARSIYGPVCFNSAAPDDGNINVLAQLGTDGFDLMVLGLLPLLVEPRPAGGVLVDPALGPEAHDAHEHHQPVARAKYTEAGAIDGGAQLIDVLINRHPCR